MDGTRGPDLARGPDFAGPCSSQSLLHVPRVKTDVGRRAFSSAAPQIHLATARNSDFIFL